MAKPLTTTTPTDLSTCYLGLKLPHPFIVGASPMVGNLDTVRRLEDAGAAAFVMESLFEEQIVMEQGRTLLDIQSHVDEFSEASSFFPEPAEFRLGPQTYLDQIRHIKAAVQVPVIASLNGISASGWLEYAKLIEQAGADALELNVYYVATDPDESGVAVERRTIDIVRTVKRAIRIPVAVKLSPFFSSLAHFAAGLESAGADGLVLFNRFYQPDIDLEELEVRNELHLSDSSELLLRVRWLAILSAQRKLDIAVSGGVHTATDAVKAVMAGARSVQVVSAILKNGPQHLATLRSELSRIVEELGYASLSEMHGCMNLARCPDPAAFERGNYMRILQSWRP
ncbi:Putative dihydropyrimidine dehydrogenase (NADP+), similar to dihydroorotate dehydrogenase [Georgfuchsia toluolica]|uniref:Dihydropyrimidine dehydrogenase (NADP+), similar to dihydroorotate dehydrogenase n=1 Tax=Georgfuchsia toluolica TaxID=424218 RepID=A0A916J589_9PROT|nr:dihydroorotate dehydrogenase-like protein [Georgfuchsia toluolica]CAG4884931.1 Putative dihydropyrimidine dehydrogenase (NADP+), similar to dihydroorotate dehydrogenase [Georgfuchsia toluolica]